jgi:UPF0755 protein
MTTPPTTEYIIQEATEPPPPRPWWTFLVKVAFAVTIVIVVAIMGVSLAESLGARAGTDAAPVTVARGLEVEFVIAPGATAREVADLLEEEGVVNDGDEFRQAVLEAGAAARLRAGTYTVLTGTPSAELIALFVEGPPEAETFRLTVIEGLDVEAMLRSLAAQTPHSFDEYSEALLSGAVTSPLLPEANDELPPLARWEGLLAPDTYEFVVDASAESMLQRLATTLANRVDNTDWSGLEGLGLTPYDGLIMASLIEKEALLDDERPTIASVIVNRLSQDPDFPLQIDATIIYALGINPGEVTLDDLEVESPYNTYLHTGLPPTPISGVRVASLQAAAHPEDTPYLYYVLFDFDGSHAFSETLEEHNAFKEDAKDRGVITE